MRLGLVHKRLDLNGGTERDLFRTAEGLRDLGHDVHLFCSEYAVPPPLGTVAHRLPVLPLGRTARLWSFALRTPRIIQAQRCDVIVSFGRTLHQDVLRSGGGTHRGFLHRLGQEGGPHRRLWQKISAYHRSLLSLEKRQFRAPELKRIIAVSAEVKQDILENYPVSEEKIVVLYNGVDLEHFYPRGGGEVRQTIRRRWKIPVDAPLVLFVGSGFRRKGLDRLISLWESPELAQVYLLVVGHDARLNRYRARVRQLEGKRIIFAGRQEDIAHYYAAADVLALPALQEAFGNVVVEALASGLPVLVSRGVGAAEILTGSLAGKIVDHPEDPNELQAKLLLLLEQAQDPRCAEEARTIAQKYSWRNHFKRLEVLLMETAKSQSEPRVA